MHARHLVLLLAACGGSPRAAPPITGKLPPSDGPRAVQISVAEGRACARMEDGSVRCWGAEADGAAEKHVPVEVPGVTGAVDLQDSGTVACARLSSGALRCWGMPLFMLENDDHDVHAGARAMPGFEHVDALWLHGGGDGCARLAGGVTKCWGGGTGFLATGFVEGGYGTMPKPVVKELRDAKQFALGESLGCVLMKDATVRCMGHNTWGEVGDDSHETRLAPVAVAGLHGVAQIAVGRESACARMTDGTVQCWGSNDNGQLADGTDRPSPTPKKMPGITDVVDLVAGDLTTCALHRDTTVTCWGPRHGAGEVPRKPWKLGLDHVVQVALAFSHGCALRDDGSVYCWGQGWRGVIGDGLQVDREAPTRVKWTADKIVSAGLPANVHVRGIAVGSLRSCAILDDGSVRCWGRNDGGMVDGTPDKTGTPLIRPTVVAKVDRAVAVSLGERESVARRDDGSLVSWGRNAGVQPVKTAPVADVRLGGMMSCTLRGDRASCSDTDDHVMTEANVTQIAVDHAFACVLHKDGTVACAGYNGRGQLGDNAGVESRASFAPVPGLRGVAQIVVGTDHACARLADGSVTCWGDGMVVGSVHDGPQPTPLGVPGLAKVVDLAAGASSMCARLQTGDVACWGHYAHNDFDAYSAKPVVVPWLAGATQLALGMFHSCALFPRDRVACWGENRDGELGDGTNDEHAKAADVRW